MTPEIFQEKLEKGIKMGYSEKFKESIMKKVYTQKEKNRAEIASEAGISNVTLYRWLKEQDKPMPKKKNTSNNFSIQEKFQLVLQSQNISGQELGKFCRENGVFTHQLQQWQQEMLQTLNSKPSVATKKEDKKVLLENKELKKELRKKDKALAEASALLVLKKKAELIWGKENEEEQD